MEKQTKLTPKRLAPIKPKALDLWDFPTKHQVKSLECQEQSQSQGHPYGTRCTTVNLRRETNREILATYITMLICNLICKEFLQINMKIEENYQLSNGKKQTSHLQTNKYNWPLNLGKDAQTLPHLKKNASENTRIIYFASDIRKYIKYKYYLLLVRN